jgi:hypothetical protein
MDVKDDMACRRDHTDDDMACRRDCMDDDVVTYVDCSINSETLCIKKWMVLIDLRF